MAPPNAAAGKQLQRIETAIPGVCLIVPPVWTDDRGAFMETYRADAYAALGITTPFVQDNQSISVRGVLRGLHLQVGKAQAKLCRVASGEVLDVAADVRRGSPTFGKWVVAKLSAENRQQIYIPPGLAHGFLVLSERAEFLYKCSDFYDASDELGIAWNDPTLAIDWGVGDPILSPKDRRLPRLTDIPEDRLPLFKST